MKEDVASTFDVKTNAIHTIKTASPSETAIALKTALAPEAKPKQQKNGPLKANVRELSDSETWNNLALRTK